jgi:hypothetical protein
LHRCHDTLRIDAIIPIEIRDGAGLTKMLDAQGACFAGAI